MDEAERLKAWIHADAGKHFWKSIENRKQEVYDQFTGRDIEDPIVEVLETQRHKAIMKEMDDLLSIRDDIDEAIAFEKQNRK